MEYSPSIIRFSDGEDIVKQGEAGDTMYVIRSGKVRIYRDADGAETTLATLAQGDFFGELALFDDKPRSASAQCVGDVEVRAITKSEFDSLTCDPLVKEVVSKLASHIRAMDDSFEKLSLEADQRRDFMSGLSLRKTWVT